jgi:hypothetical protein
MKVAFVVHSRFDGWWPFVADELRRQLVALGPVEFVRSSGADDPVSLLSAPKSVGSLILLGHTISPAAVERLPSLKSIWIDSLTSPPATGVALHDTETRLADAFADALLYDEHTYGAQNIFDLGGVDHLPESWAQKSVLAWNAKSKTAWVLRELLERIANNPSNGFDAKHLLVFNGSDVKRQATPPIDKNYTSPVVEHNISTAMWTDIRNEFDVPARMIRAVEVK